jgi:hypothetical protein
MGIRIQNLGKTPNKMENGTWIGYKENLTRHIIQKCSGISGHWSFTLSLLVKDFAHELGVKAGTWAFKLELCVDIICSCEVVVG